MEKQHPRKTDPRIRWLGLSACLAIPLLIALGVRDSGTSALDRIPDLVPILALSSFLALWPRGSRSQLRRSTLAGLGFLFFGCLELTEVLNETFFFGQARPEKDGLQALGPLVLGISLGFSGSPQLRKRLHPITAHFLAPLLTALIAVTIPVALTRLGGFESARAIPHFPLAAFSALGFAAAVYLRRRTLRRNAHPALLGLATAAAAGALERTLSIFAPDLAWLPELGLWVVVPAAVGTAVEDLALLRRSTYAGLRVALLGTSSMIGIASVLVASMIGPEISGSVRLSLLAIVALSGLSILFTAFAHRRLVERIDSLVEAARDWTGGSLDRFVVIDRDDEVGRLSLAFNGMVERLGLQKEELQVLAEAMKGSRDGIVLLDDRGRVEFVNSSFLKRSGKPMRSLVGRPLAALVETPDQEAFSRDLRLALEGHGRFSADVTVVGAESKHRELSLTLTRVESGGFLAQFRDTSVLRRMERERAEYTQSIVAINRTAQRIMDDMEVLNFFEVTCRAIREEYGVDSRIWILDEPQEGEAPPQELRLAATSLEHGGDLSDVRTPLGQSLAGQVALGRTAITCWSPERARTLFSDASHGFSFLGPQGAYPLIGCGRVLGVLEMTLSDQGHERSSEVLGLLAKILSAALANAELFRRSNEQKLELEQSARRLKRAKSHLELSTAELREANAKLVEADRSKSLFLSTASHELRTPVGSAIGLIDLILDGATKDEEDRRDLLTRSRNCMIHLRTIVNDLLDVARIEAGRLEIDRRDVSLGGIFEEVRALTGADSIDEAISLRIDDVSDLIVSADRQRLVQILVNLLGNAIKFTEEGSIRMTAVPRPERGFVEIRVRDTGIGLNPEDCRRVFDVFTQADGSDTRAFGGSGLGLAISKRLAGMMGGTLRLESEGPGRGACAVLTLPPARRDHAWREDLLDVGVHPPRGRLILVDGDPAHLVRAGTALAKEGWQVMARETADEAYALAITTRPDWILSEYALPHEGGAGLGSGLSLARALFRDDALADTRFALVTGLDVRDEPLAGALGDDSEILVLEKSRLEDLVAQLERDISPLKS
jgi:PAS domain S-box-containing protein